MASGLSSLKILSFIPKVYRDSAACFELLAAKWLVPVVLPSRSHAGFAVCNLLTWQLLSNCKLLRSDRLVVRAGHAG